MVSTPKRSSSWASFSCFDDASAASYDDTPHLTSDDDESPEILDPPQQEKKTGESKENATLPPQQPAAQTTPSMMPPATVLQIFIGYVLGHLAVWFFFTGKAQPHYKSCPWPTVIGSTATVHHTSTIFVTVTSPPTDTLEPSTTTTPPTPSITVTNTTTTTELIQTFTVPHLPVKLDFLETGTITIRGGARPTTASGPEAVMGRDENMFDEIAHGLQNKSGVEILLVFLERLAEQRLGNDEEGKEEKGEDTGKLEVGDNEDDGVA
ncbi:hypothetical protein CC86DRAFT_160241 [Ophiobolus disseminans]|uniref:Uncharacterized protein n=1 Tax=Ophiobolus disseminans TaxID=1469910 RepID=A0A6A7ACC3_9PLEO|nr:hypothetical protein CC86DRAFT_160241 [Ophiobolus disseminans]